MVFNCIKCISYFIFSRDNRNGRSDFKGFCCDNFTHSQHPLYRLLREDKPEEEVTSNKFKSPQSFGSGLFVSGGQGQVAYSLLGSSSAPGSGEVLQATPSPQQWRWG
jgi:hypothetical protein